MLVPDAVISLAIAPKDKDGAGQLLEGAQPLHEGRPDLPRASRRRVGADHHLGHGRASPRDLLERMKREYNCEVIVGKPQVAFRETITQARPSSTTRTRSRPVARVSSRKVVGYIEPLPADAVEHVRVRRRHHRRHRFRASSFPACDKGFKEAVKQGLAHRLPDRRRPRRHQRRRSSTTSTRPSRRSRRPRSWRFREAYAEAEADGPRADHEARSPGARRVPGRRHGSDQPAPRHDHQQRRTPKATSSPPPKCR